MAGDPLVIIFSLQLQPADPHLIIKVHAPIRQMANSTLSKLPDKNVVGVPVELPLPVHAALMIPVPIKYRIPSGQFSHQKQGRFQVCPLLHHHHIPAHQDSAGIHLIDGLQKPLLPSAKAVVVKVRQKHKPSLPGHLLRRQLIHIRDKILSLIRGAETAPCHCRPRRHHHFPHTRSIHAPKNPRKAPASMPQSPNTAPTSVCRAPTSQIDGLRPMKIRLLHPRVRRQLQPDKIPLLMLADRAHSRSLGSCQHVAAV